MTKNKQNYMNNPNLPAVGAEFEYTSSQINQLQKAAKNLLYFAENFFYIISLDEGKQKIKLHLPQKRALRRMRDNRFFILLASRQIGKALALDTPIPTPNGWTTMGELKDGDIVFDNKGQPTTVTKAWDVMVDRPCYKVIFDNGEEIVADQDHLWFTQDTIERRIGSAGSKKTTVDIYNDLYRTGKEPNHRIPISMTGVEYKEKDLPIDPYILGLWLGDGCNDSSIITVGDRDASEMQEILKEQSQFDKIQLKTYQKGSNSLLVTVNEGIQTKSLNTLLKANKLLHNKHIPVEYTTSSRDQRLELLRGLMDSDGYISKTGIAQFYNMNLGLVKHVKNLIASLGYKVTYKENDIWYKGTYQGKCGVLTYTPREYVAKLAFKRDRIKRRLNVNDSRRRAHWHYIKDIIPVESEPVRCITVDSDDSMFLCGNQYIPTSNTTMMTIYALWIACFNDDQKILIVANKEGTAIEIMQRIRMAYEELPNWLKPGVKEYGKTALTLANGTRIGISTTTGTAARGQSVNCLILDELAFIEPHLVEEFWKSVYPIVSSSKKSKIFIASTANGTGNLFYKLYSGADSGETNWACDKILWNEIPGRDERWKNETIASIGSAEAWSQEFECNFIDSGESSVNEELFARLMQKTREPKFIFDEGKYLLWDEPNAEGVYIVSVDTAEGVGADYSVVQIFDYKDLTSIKQVATYCDNNISPYNFTEKVHEILQHWGNPLVCIERNNCGAQVVDNLSKHHEYENIVSWGASTAGRSKGQLGIVAHTNTKHKGVTNMRYWVNELESVDIRDVNLVKELRDFVRYPNGTWAAKRGAGNHDDRVMSMIWNLIILEDEVVKRHFEVAQLDKNNKPLQIKQFDFGIKYFMNPTSIYSNEREDSFDNAPPVLIGNAMNQSSDIDQLIEMGFTTLQ